MRGGNFDHIEKKLVEPDYKLCCAYNIWNHVNDPKTPPKNELKEKAICNGSEFLTLDA
jgi:hypothetical protein